MSDEIKQEIISISSNLSEAAIDSFLSEGLFKDIPVIGTIISIGNLTKNVGDALLLMRILSFIKALDVKSEKEVEEIKQKYFKDKDYKRVGSKILFVLEKIDDATKVKWLAKSFRMYLDRKVNTKEFLRLTSIINNAFVSDVEQIVAFNERTQIRSNNELIESYVLDHLFSIGIMENIGIDGGDFSGKNSGTIYGLNKFGSIILKELL